MGIYNNGNIYGIRIYKFNDNDFSDILFEQKYNVVISDEQKKEAFLFYNSLNNKKEISFNILTECCTTYDLNNKDTFMMWYPLSLNQFIEKFGYQIIKELR
jgi:hypothetical protein